MNCKTQVALAAGAGYLLGRQRKLRWGLLLAAAAMSGRLTRPGALLDHGLRALKSTPEVGKLGEMGAPLVSAAKDAARTAVTGRIGSLSDRLRERAGKVAEEPEPEEEEEEEPEETPARRARAAGGARRPRPKAQEPDEDEYDENEDEDEDEDEENEDEEEDRDKDEDEELVTAGRRRGRRPPVRRRGEG
ncbi:hypothetical protein ACQP1P_20695 [Dactylosporangium sp. CA-052675]|uniref:hypothetical protein n=1 Tax=Dactylosporangium sp. CA-052675 TaxID=3239927 RepID=UPI003D93C9BA